MRVKNNERETCTASETDRVSKIYRAKGADISFDGIKQNHVAR